MEVVISDAIATRCEETTFHKRGFFLECKSMSFNSILRRAVPRRYIGNILTRYIGTNASES